MRPVPEEVRGGPAACCFGGASVRRCAMVELACSLAAAHAHCRGTVLSVFSSSTDSQSGPFWYRKRYALTWHSPSGPWPPARTKCKEKSNRADCGLDARPTCSTTEHACHILFSHASRNKQAHCRVTGFKLQRGPLTEIVKTSVQERQVPGPMPMPPGRANNDGSRTRRVLWLQFLPSAGRLDARDTGRDCGESQRPRPAVPNITSSGMAFVTMRQSLRTASVLARALR